MASLTLAQFCDDRMPLIVYRTNHQRIGSFMNEQIDKWWVVTNMMEAMTAANEIGTILKNEVLPVLSRLTSTNDYIPLWQRKEYGGITEAQRKMYLEMLNAR